MSAADPAGSDESLARLLKRTEQTVLRAKSAALKPAGVTLAQYVVLSELDARPGRTSAQLARACLVTPQAMMVLLKTLEEQGWVTRTRHPRHQTVLETHLTDVGRKTLTRARRSAQPVERRIEDALAPRDARRLRYLLSRLIDAASQ